MKYKIAIVGEAYGEQEEREGRPFVGAAGHELDRLLGEAEISRQECFITNVFNLRPKYNKIEFLCSSKGDGIAGYPAILTSKYIDQKYASELDRLGDELLEADPNVILALGNTACWALLGRTAISKLRGTTDITTHTVQGFKILPTYHPAAIFRQYELRPIIVVDFQKAAREREFAEIRRPKRSIWIEPSLEDMETFYEHHIRDCKILSVDIETAGTHITCIGFAPNPAIGLVVPFADHRKQGRNYWAEEESERAAWAYVRRICEDRKINKVFQNGLYDIAFLFRAYGIRTHGAEEDTMLLHHALQPESLKGLGFLGSVYTDEGAWKHLRQKHTTIKKDD